jgi:hypothetical protein
VNHLRRLSRAHNDRSRVQRPICRRVPQRPLLEPERLPWPSPCHQRLGTPLTPPAGRIRLTTLTQASLTLQTARSLRPASHPTSRSRTGASLPATQASPRTGLTPAGHRELVVPTSCGPPFPHNAETVPAHGDTAVAKRGRDRQSAGRAAKSRLAFLYQPIPARGCFHRPFMSFRACS